MKNTQRGFIGIIAIVLVALAVIGGGAYFYSTQKEANVEMSDAQVDTSVAISSSTISNTVQTSVQSPDVMVKEYYQNIISRLNGGSQSDLSLNSNYVTAKVVNNFEALKKANPDGILYNPFICAQDYPENTSEMRVETVTNNNSKATVNVTIFAGSPISVSLVNENGWKINEISCSQGTKL